MKQRLARDATLRTALPLLRVPEEYVRNVFSNMAGMFRDCQVRLFVDSNPAWPDYVIEMLFDDVVDGEEVEVSQSLAVFNGRSHQGDLTKSDDYKRLWSTAAMNWAEVQTLLGELRGILPLTSPPS
jgi:hypothetical protein